MEEWRFEDDIFTPEAKLRINYEGPEPFKVYKPTPILLRKVHGIGAEDVWEREFRWDTTSDPRSFFVRIYGNRGFDDRTRMLVEVVFEGAQPSDPAKPGRVVITINGRLITRYSFTSPFQKTPIYKGLIWLYFKIFYNEVRRGYLKMGQTELFKLENAFREMLGLAPRGV